MKIDDSGTSHRRVGAENRFKVRAVRRRGARQLLEQAQNYELPNKEKALSVAAREIYEGRLEATND